MTGDAPQAAQPADDRLAETAAPGVIVAGEGGMSRWPSGLLIWFGAVLITGSLVALGLVLWQMRDAAFDKARADLRRLALSQSEQTAAVLKGADLALLDLINDLKRGPSDGESRHRALQAMVTTLPQLNNLFAVDAHGQSISSARSNPPPQLSLADTPYFKAHEAGHRGVLLPPTSRTRLDGRWSLLLSRRGGESVARVHGTLVPGLHPPLLPPPSP